MSDTQDPSVLILVPRGRGRPRSTETLERLSTRLPTREYDRLVKLASTRDQSLSSLVRDLLVMTRRS